MLKEMAIILAGGALFATVAVVIMFLALVF